jgi:hypothetical protein
LDTSHKNGLFNCHYHKSTKTDLDSEEVHEKNPLSEEVWAKKYEDRKKNWKLKQSSSSSVQSELLSASAETMQGPLPNVIADGSAFRSVNNQISSVLLPIYCYICQDISALQPENPVNLDQVIKKFNLNKEQSRAFMIVAKHSLQPGQPPLRMYLGGPGRTGKTRVIESLK